MQNLITLELLTFILDCRLAPSGSRHRQIKQTFVVEVDVIRQRLIEGRNERAFVLEKLPLCAIVFLLLLPPLPDLLLRFLLFLTTSFNRSWRRRSLFSGSWSFLWRGWRRSCFYGLFGCRLLCSLFRFYILFFVVIVRICLGFFLLKNKLIFS